MHHLKLLTDELIESTQMYTCVYMKIKIHISQSLSLSHKCLNGYFSVWFNLPVWVLWCECVFLPCASCGCHNKRPLSNHYQCPLARCVWMWWQGGGGQEDGCGRGRMVKWKEVRRRRSRGGATACRLVI